MIKLQKILITIIILSLFLPFIFTIKKVYSFSRLPDLVTYTPNAHLLIIPLFLLALVFIIEIWRTK